MTVPVLNVDVWATKRVAQRALPAIALWMITLSACCAKQGKEANMARWPENKVLPDAEQMELNLTN